MPTEPLLSIIYRELAVANAKTTIDIASPLLEELVNFGSSTLVRCATSATGEDNEDLAAQFLYRHILEMTDATQALVAQACAVPAIPLVRSTFEALIALDYIVADRGTYVQRSLAWLVDYLHRKLQVYELLDPTTPAGIEFQAAIRRDKTIGTVPLPPIANVDKAIANLTDLLADPQFATLDADFLALPTPRSWYRLYGGPTNLRELAYAVDRSALYDFMYRYWSRIAHATDFGPFITPTAQGHGTIRPIRDPTELKNTASFAATLMLAATDDLIRHFRPTEDTKTWYEREVGPMYRRVYSNA